MAAASRTLPASSAPGGGSLHPVLEGTALALLAARWFTPAEGVDRGYTLWIALGWLAWGALAAWTAFRDGRTWTLRPTAWGVALGALIGGHLLSALAVVLTTGQKRAALNAFWEWLSVAITAVWIRESSRDPQFGSRVARLIVSAAVALAGLGLWQQQVWQPRIARSLTEFDALEREFSGLQGAERSAAAMRLHDLARDLGPEYLSLDPNGRRSMRQRLVESTEPLGQFALANSFAGLLVVAMFLACGGVLNWPRGEPPAKRLAMMAALVLIAYVLVLTKSRTALVGAAAGIVALALGLASGRLKRVLTVTGSALAALGAVMAVAWATGGLDRLVVSEAPKSMRYRLDYWRSTCEVIRAHPWLGVGAGNFRQHYLRYKLPESSEEILDPHNLFLDAWANGGLLALAGLIGLIALAMRQGRPPQPGTIAETEPAPKREARRGLVSGALLAGTLLVAGEASIFEGAFDWRVAWLGLAAALIGACLVPVAAVDSNSSALGIRSAWIALTIHLLGAGGIGMPAISEIWIWLVAMRISSPAINRAPSRTLAARRLQAALALVLAGLTAVQLMTATGPVLQARVLMASADYFASIDRNLRRAEQLDAQAAQADRLDPEPWRRLAQVQLAEWEGDGDSRSFDRSVRSQLSALELDPRNAHDQRNLGETYLRRAEHGNRPEDAAQALDWLQKAAQDYPAHSLTQADLARAAAIADRLPLAVRAAQRAIELDDINRRLGHYDRLLPDELLIELRRIAGP